MATVDTALKNEKDWLRHKPLRIGLIHTKIIEPGIVAAMEAAFPDLEGTGELFSSRKNGWVA